MNDKKEIEIYVATDSEGLVLYSQEITEEHPSSLPHYHN